VPTCVDIAEFEAMLHAMDALHEARLVRVLIHRSDHAGAPVQFELLAAATAANEILTQHGLDRRSFANAAADAADVIWAVLDEASEEQFVELRTNRDVYGADADDASIAERKFHAVIEHFDIETLRRRYWVKNSAKASNVARFGWQVVESSLADDGVPPGGGSVRYGILRVIGDPGPVFPDEQVTLALDIEDVEYMLASLTRLRDALRDELSGR
jgi:hypothetical protein